MCTTSYLTLWHIHKTSLTDQPKALQLSMQRLAIHHLMDLILPDMIWQNEEEYIVIYISNEQGMLFNLKVCI
jgi:hypothetical protein